jgi:LmbE family N-acetylglucosaminyl deacetylase
VTGTFRPNLFINIKETWPQKLQALKAYSSEMRAAPHIRSLEGLAVLAQLRGMQTGLEMAEAFEVLRKVEV